MAIHTPGTPSTIRPPLADGEALQTGAGWSRRRDRGLVQLQGEDRVRFLQGMVTCDVAALSPAGAGFGYFTSPRGQVLADASVAAGPEALSVWVPATELESIADHLRRYIVMDRVAVAAVTVESLLVGGPRAETVLAAAGFTLPAAGDEGSAEHGEGELGGSPVSWWRASRVGVSGLRLTATAATLDVLAVSLGKAGAREVGEEVWETVRFEAGIPRWGVDYGEGTLPQELGEDGAVSYEKGCYLGQEVVARIHFRGRVQRHLRALRYRGPAPSVPHVLQSTEGREIRRAGRTVASPRLAAMLSLAVLHERGGEPGDRVSVVVEGVEAGEAEVLEIASLRATTAAEPG